MVDGGELVGCVPGGRTLPNSEWVFITAMSDTPCRGAFLAKNYCFGLNKCVVGEITGHNEPSQLISQDDECSTVQ